MNLAHVCSAVLTLSVLGCQQPTPVPTQAVAGHRADGRFVERYPSGERHIEGTIRSGVEDGDLTVWYANGHTQLKSRFTLGRENGVRREWFDAGAPKAEGMVSDGLRTGAWTNWYASGQVRATTTFVRDVEQGTRAEFHDTGARMSQAEMYGGLQHGLRTFWYPSGHVRNESTFDQGKLHGLEREWAADGAWLRATCWDHDQRRTTWTAAHGETLETATSKQCP